MIITFGQFSLYNITYVDRSIDTPIVELNDHTLREVFDDGNDFKGSFVVVAGTFTTLETNDYYRITRTSTSGTVLRIGIPTNVSNNDVYWLKINYKKNDIGTSNAITLRNTPDSYAQDIVNTPASVEEQFSNLKITTTSTANRLSIGFGIPNGEYVDIGKTVIWINLSYFGIDNLSVSEMDSYFNEYQELKEVSEHSYTYSINEVTLTDFMVVLSSAVIWFFVIKFLKEVF